jgi:chemotaxis protein MotB
MKNILFLSIIASIITTSCVSTKKFDEQKALVSKYIDEKEDCQETLKSTEELLTETKEKLSSSTNENIALKGNVSRLTKATKNLSQLAEEEKKLREKTSQDYEKHMLSSSKKEENLTQDLAEKERLLTNKEATLLSIQKDLEKRETEVKTFKKKLVKKENDLNIAQSSLTEKSIRIEELESKINAQNSAMNDLKGNITKALKEFTSEDLTVSEKAGKIYVSLSENLLFKSGSFNLDQKGADAITKLAEVLAKQKNVDIIVEGHTDSDPFKGSGALLDNWDLSVKRATSVVRILEKNNVPKDRIVASGRADHIALTANSTKEEKAKNRRTEIILSPDLDHLMNLLQSK